MAIFRVAEHDDIGRFQWRSYPKLGGTSLTTPREWPGTNSQRRKGVGSGCCRRRWKTEECRHNAHRGKQGRGGRREHRHRWPAKGNGGVDGVECLPTGDDGGGGSDRGRGDDSSMVLSHERRSMRQCVVARWSTPPDRRAPQRSQPMTDGPTAGNFQTQNKLLKSNSTAGK
jgi:hypothetical protein